MAEENKKEQGLNLLRQPFLSNQINQLPKGTKAQNECPAAEKVNCKICGGWHHPKVIHLSYVGHAALTDRLLDADPLWAWEPFALKDGLPAFDSSGGLWIKLTVLGMTRIGYGHAAASQWKEIGSREKEVIGDALRNAAMRFGAALDLWFKGDLHPENGDKAMDESDILKSIKKDTASQEKTAKAGDDASNLPPDDKQVENIIFCKIKNIALKEGTSPKLYVIETANGDKYGTFSDKIADIATSLKNSGKMGRMEFKQGKKNKEVVLLSRSLQ